MKKVFLSYFLFLSVCAIYAQNSTTKPYLTFDSQTLISDKINTARIPFAKSSEEAEIAICLYDIDKCKDSIPVCIYDMETSKTSIEHYKIKHLVMKLTKNYRRQFKSMFFDKSYIAFGMSDKVYIFSRSSGELEKILEDEVCQYGAFLDNSIFLYENYNHRHSIQTRFSLYSLSDYKLIKSIEPKFENIYYTHITPNHWIDIANQSILIGQVLDYNLNIYDNNLVLRDSSGIKNPESWFSLNKKQKRKLKNKYAIEAINLIDKTEFFIDRVPGYYIISDSCILINRLNKPNEIYNDSLGRLSFQVLKKRNNRWEIASDNLKDLTLPNLSNDDISLFGGSYSRNFIFTDKYAFVICAIADIPIFDQSYEEYRKKCDDYYFDKSPSLQILKFQHSFNQ